MQSGIESNVRSYCCSFPDVSNEAEEYQVFKSMVNFLLFLVTVVIWGSTWIAIAMQVGDVPLIVSVFYRFAVAAAIFLPALAIFNRLNLPSFRHHPYIIIQALCLFRLNFVLLYWAALYIPSGLIAVIFSLSTVYNAINAYIFFSEPISRRVIFFSILGLIRLVFIFLPDAVRELGTGAILSETLSGVALAAAGTLLFSIGNMASRHNSAHGLSTMSTNAWSMAYGAIVMIMIILVTSTPITAPPDVTYIAALLYLLIIGFTTYLMLVVRVGSSQAAYATVLFPIFAITLSAFFEGYQITPTTIVGMFLALSGNIIMFSKFNFK